MRIKLDENLPRRLKGTLASLQHDVVRVEDEHLLAASSTRYGGGGGCQKRESSSVYA